MFQVRNSSVETGASFHMYNHFNPEPWDRKIDQYLTALFFLCKKYRLFFFVQSSSFLSYSIWLRYARISSSFHEPVLYQFTYWLRQVLILWFLSGKLVYLVLIFTVRQVITIASVFCVWRSSPIVFEAIIYHMVSWLCIPRTENGNFLI